MARFTRGWVPFYREDALGDNGKHLERLGLHGLFVVMANLQKTTCDWQAKHRVLPTGHVLTGYHEIAKTHRTDLSMVRRQARRLEDRGVIKLEPGGGRDGLIVKVNRFERHHDKKETDWFMLQRKSAYSLDLKHFGLLIRLAAEANWAQETTVPWSGAQRLVPLGSFASGIESLSVAHKIKVDEVQRLLDGLSKGGFIQIEPEPNGNTLQINLTPWSAYQPLREDETQMTQERNADDTNENQNRNGAASTLNRTCNTTASILKKGDGKKAEGKIEDPSGTTGGTANPVQDREHGLGGKKREPASTPTSDETSLNDWTLAVYYDCLECEAKEPGKRAAFARPTRSVLKNIREGIKRYGGKDAGRGAAFLLAARAQAWRNAYDAMEKKLTALLDKWNASTITLKIFDETTLSELVHKAVEYDKKAPKSDLGLSKQIALCKDAKHHLTEKLHRILVDAEFDYEKGTDPSEVEPLLEPVKQFIADHNLIERAKEEVRQLNEECEEYKRDYPERFAPMK